MNASIHALAILASAALFVAGMPSQAQAADNQQGKQPAEQTSRKEMTHRDVVPQGSATRMKRNGMKMTAPKVQSRDRQTEGHGAAEASLSPEQQDPAKRK